MARSRRRGRRKAAHDRPLRLRQRLVRPSVIEETVRALRLVKTQRGTYLVANLNDFLMRPVDPIECGTRDEALLRAREAVRRDAEYFIKKQEYIERELLCGLEWMEHSERWLLPEGSFRTFLNRIRDRGHGIFGIEIWRTRVVGGRRDFQFEDAEVHERYGRKPEDPMWYMQAFARLAHTSDLLYTASVSVSTECLEKV